MKQELIKKAFKLGNSAGVLLPIEWINKKVSVKLVEESISQDIFEILEKSNFYKNTIGKVQINKNILEMESIIRINQKAIEIDEELGEKVLDETLYSLILRLREIYLIGCLKNKKIPSNKEFLNLIRRVASEESYNAYIRIKNDLKSKKVIPVEEAKSLIEEIKRGIERLKHGK